MSVDKYGELNTAIRKKLGESNGRPIEHGVYHLPTEQVLDWYKQAPDIPSIYRDQPLNPETMVDIVHQLNHPFRRVVVLLARSGSNKYDWAHYLTYDDRDSKLSLVDKEWWLWSRYHDQQPTNRDLETFTGFVQNALKPSRTIAIRAALI